MTDRHNDPNHGDGDEASDRGALIAFVAIVSVLVVGAVFYALNRDDQTASTTSSPPATTGQSQKAPAPPPSNDKPAPKGQ